MDFSVEGEVESFNAEPIVVWLKHNIIITIRLLLFPVLMALPSTTLNSKQRCPIKAKKKPTLTDLIKEPTEKDNERNYITA